MKNQKQGLVCSNKWQKKSNIKIQGGHLPAFFIALPKSNSTLKDIQLICQIKKTLILLQRKFFNELFHILQPKINIG